MVKLRPKNIEEVNANKVAPDFAKWCNNKSDCMYKDKKRKYHGWLNLDNLTKKNKVAQCGWDNGNCNHTTKHGIGGYSNVCPIGGFNGDLPWPAVIRLSKFDFAGHGIKSGSKIKSIKVTFYHRMVAIDTGTGKKYENFGPTFHNSSGGWAVKVYFGNKDKKVSKVYQDTHNPELSFKKYRKVECTFTDVSITELLQKKFALNIEYNHNYNTNPGIIYVKNVVIDVDFSSATKYIEGSRSAKSLYTGIHANCKTTLTHTIEAGYKQNKKKMKPKDAPAKLGSQIYVKSKPKDVTVTKITKPNYKSGQSSDNTVQYLIKDNSNVSGKKTITYALSNDKKKIVNLTYTAKKRSLPTWNIIQDYKSYEDFDATKEYIKFQNGCASGIKIYADSIQSTPLELSVVNQNSENNLLNTSQVQAFHNFVKKLSCGFHTLYIQRGEETKSQAKKNTATVRILPMNYEFTIYTDTKNTAEFDQIKDAQNSMQTLYVKRIDDEPIAQIPKISIFAETNEATGPIELVNVKKGIANQVSINTYYSGDFLLTIQDIITGCPMQEPLKYKITINSTHKQHYDYLFTRATDGTPPEFEYLVAWEGDKLKGPTTVSDVNLFNSSDNIIFCSESKTIGLSEVGYLKFNVTNKNSTSIENLSIELNTLVENDNGVKEVTTTEWTSPSGIFNQFYDLFYMKNQELGENVEVRNLSPDNDLIDEENVYLFIHKIDPQDTVSINIPFRSTIEKTVYLQYLLLEEPHPIRPMGQCNNASATTDDMIQIDIIDSMLTQLDIFGETDLLSLDTSFECPDECYTTKTSGDVQSGGITYRITNIDTNDFSNETLSTVIYNDPALQPYGYKVGGNYYSLYDNNGNRITPQENTNSPNRVEFIQQETTTTTELQGYVVKCTTSFPDTEESVIYERTNKYGIAEFFIEIPQGLNASYNQDELANVICFDFAETQEYRASQYCGSLNPHKNTVSVDNLDKNQTFMEIPKDYRRYKSGDIVYIPVTLFGKAKYIENKILFSPKLSNTKTSDEVTVMYKICNVKNNEGIFLTTFQTNHKKLIPNKVSKEIYVGMDTDIKVRRKLEKEVLESKTLNVIYLTVQNGLKKNKEVMIKINLGKLPDTYMGDYDFIDINIDEGDYAIEELPDKSMVVTWLIGEMESLEKQFGIIKIEAKSVGLSQIRINQYDYIHKENGTVNIIKHLCEKCNDSKTKWRLADSAWKQFDRIWYKKINGVYKRKVNGQWVAKQ